MFGLRSFLQPLWSTLCSFLSSTLSRFPALLYFRASAVSRDRSKEDIERSGDLLEGGLETDNVSLTQFEPSSYLIIHL